MDQRTTGIILRTHPLTETSLIINWLTFDLGRVATVAKGARRPKSPLRGKLDLFYLADFSFAPSRRSSLHILRELSLRNTNSGLRFDLAYLQQASYCATLIEQTTETETPLGGIANLFAGLLHDLPQRPPHASTVFAFEMKLWRELGLSPDIQSSRLSPGAKQILSKLLELDWPAVSRLQFGEGQFSELSNYLHHHLTRQVDMAPRTRNQALGREPSHSHQAMTSSDGL
jgi:DNA repair protein RecO (recombination protein O)